MDRLRQDLRVALRRLRKSPGFTITAVATLALAIGANTTVFTALNSILLRPLPGVTEARSLVFVQGRDRGFPTLSYPDYKDVRDRNTVLSGLMAYRFAPISLSGSGTPGAESGNARLWSYLVTGNYFDVLGVRAMRGRLLTPDDDRQLGGHPVAVLGYDAWQRRFGGDPSIVNRAIKINGLDYTVVGIAPRHFRGTELFFSPDVFVPMMMQPQIEARNAWLTYRQAQNIFVAGRLKPGVSIAQAESAVNVIAAQLAREHPQTHEGMALVLTPPGLAGNMLRGPVMGFAGVLMGVAALVLLMACTNLASLLLARGADRGRELAIRLACGAERRQILRQLLTENLVLASLGAIAGLGLAVWLTGLFRAWRPPIDFPLTTDLAVDWRVFAFTLGLTMLATVLFGLVPARRASRADVVSALKQRDGDDSGLQGGRLQGRRLRRWHLRDLLVGVQVALSVLLVVGSVLVVRSLQQSLALDLGFNPVQAVTVSFDLGLQGYTSERADDFEQRLLARVQALPGVEHAGLINSLPLSLNRSNSTITVDGKEAPRGARAPTAVQYQISHGYVRAMQTRLVAGRDLDPRDRRGAPAVALVNRAFARQLLRPGEPVGQRFRAGTRSDPIEVVGVVEDGKYGSLGEGPTPALFLSMWQSAASSAALVVRTRLPENETLRAVRQAVLNLDPTLPLFETGTLTQHLDLPMFPARLAAFVLGLFGVLAMVLAATGLYGVMAYAVARRTREIGIRMAIGASRGQVLRLIVGRAALLLGVSLAIGLLLAVPFAQVLTRITYGVDARDPATFGVALLVMLGVALGACWPPVRVATSIDPMRALRND